MFPPYNSTFAVKSETSREGRPRPRDDHRGRPEGPDRRGDAGAGAPRRPRQEDAGGSGRRVPEGVGPHAVTKPVVRLGLPAPAARGGMRAAGSGGCGGEVVADSVAGRAGAGDQPGARDLLPAEDVRMDLLEAVSKRTFCGGRAWPRTTTWWWPIVAPEAAAWTSEPVESCAELTGLVALPEVEPVPARLERGGARPGPRTASGARRHRGGGGPEGRAGNRELVSVPLRYEDGALPGAGPQLMPSSQRNGSGAPHRRRWPRPSRVDGRARSTGHRAGGRIRAGAGRDGGSAARRRRHPPGGGREECSAPRGRRRRIWPGQLEGGGRLRSRGRDLVGFASPPGRSSVSSVAADRALSELGAERFEPGDRALTHCNTGPLATGGYGTAPRRVARGGGRARLGERDPPAAPGRSAHGPGAGAIRDPVHRDRRLRGRLADGLAARWTGWWWARTGSPPTATWRTRSAPTPWPCWPPGTTSRSTWPRRSRRSTRRPPTAPPSRSRSATRRRSRSSRASRAANPAFDVTPAELVTAIFTEAGVLEPPYPEAIARVAR